MGVVVQRRAEEAIGLEVGWDLSRGGRIVDWAEVDFVRAGIAGRVEVGFGHAEGRGSVRAGSDSVTDSCACMDYTQPLGSVDGYTGCAVGAKASADPHTRQGSLLLG